MTETRKPTYADARKQASNILFAVAVIQLICGGILIVAAPQVMGAPLPENEFPFILAEWLGTAIVFGLLGFWARSTPLPPLIIGLTLYVGIMTAATIANPESIKNGIVIKIGIIAGLILAIKTCLNAKPGDTLTNWSHQDSDSDDWDGRSTGKRHDPEHDGYS